MRSILSNKKGASIDSLYTIALVFGAGIIFLTALLYWHYVSAIPELFGSGTGLTIKNNTDQFYSNMDLIATLFYFSVNISVIFLGYKIKSHPVLYSISFILILIIPVIAAPLSNSYESLLQDTAIQLVSNDIPVFNAIMSNLVLLQIVWSGLFIIVTLGFSGGKNSNYYGVL